jgi:5'-deoxynucleotidase YfbR-like HD superfamily hydrolase
MIITKEFFRNYPHMENQVSMSVVLEKALTHDLEEAITSDIPSNVKHISPEFNDVIQEVICRMMTECYEDTSDTFHDILEISINSKKGIEGSIVSLADILELSIYCCEEVCAGNFFMKGLLIKCIRLVENSNFYKLYNLPFVNNLVESIKMLSAKNGCSIAAIQELYHL